MSVYVGIDVHRKRSQVAVIDSGGEVLANRNVPSGTETIPRRSRPRSAGGGCSSCWRTTASTRTWCTRRSARRLPRPG